MELMIKVISGVGALVLFGVNSLPTDQDQPNRAERSAVLVADWTEPVPDPVPNDPPASSGIRPSADEPSPSTGASKPAGPDFKTFNVKTADCECDCPNEAELRKILREELAAALTAHRAFQAKPGGSGGGSVTMSSGPVVVSSVVSSSGSTGGKVVSSPPPVLPRVQAVVKGAAKVVAAPVRKVVTAPFVLSRSNYVGTDGCTYQRLQMSDGTTQSRKISCPLSRGPVRRLFGR